MRVTPDISKWRGPFRGWGVYYTRVRRSMGGRLVAVFRGKFAKIQAEHRANLLNLDFYSPHRPEPVRISKPPHVGSCAVLLRKES